MKNQALVAAISGLLIGGVGFTNKINFLQVTGFGLLISSVAVTLTKDSKKTDPEIINITPETPELPETPETPELPKTEKPFEKPIKKSQQSIKKSVEKPIKKSQQSIKKPFEKPIKAR